MQAEDRVIQSYSMHCERTNPLRNLHQRMEELRAEFMRIQQDGSVPIPECLARLDVLRIEIRHTFAQIQSHSHGGMV
jgi:hypothetical protein